MYVSHGITCFHFSFVMKKQFVTMFNLRNATMTYSDSFNAFIQSEGFQRSQTKDFLTEHLKSN
jgi:hypothetical protein